MREPDNVRQQAVGDIRISACRERGVHYFENFQQNFGVKKWSIRLTHQRQVFVTRQYLSHQKYHRKLQETYKFINKLILCCIVAVIDKYKEKNLHLSEVVSSDANLTPLRMYSSTFAATCCSEVGMLTFRRDSSSSHHTMVESNLSLT